MCPRGAAGIRFGLAAGWMAKAIEAESGADYKARDSRRKCVRGRRSRGTIASFSKVADDGPACAGAAVPPRQHHAVPELFRWNHLRLRAVSQGSRRGREMP